MSRFNLAAEMGGLPSELLELLRLAGRLAEGQGQRLFLVGGAVRDLLVGSAGLDIDLAVEGDAIKLAKALVLKIPGSLVVHGHFGTATLQLGRFRLDFAATRSETYSRPGALPAVSPGTLEADLARRDFTLNAMALDLGPARWGELVDLYGGWQDLKNRLIRVLHPRSFVDDATRIMRAVRYEQRLGFNLEPYTARLLRRDRKKLNTISGDRLRREIELIFREEYPEKVLSRAAGLGVLQQVHPSLKGNGWLGWKFLRVRGITLTGKERLPLYFSLLAYRLTPQEGEELLYRLKASKVTIRTVQDTLKIKAGLSALALPGITPSFLYEWLRPYHPLAVQANAVAGSPMVRRHLEIFLRRLSRAKPLLSGDDLINMGVPAGPGVGQALEKLLMARLDGGAKTKGEEEALVRHLVEGIGEDETTSPARS